MENNEHKNEELCNNCKKKKIKYKLYLKENITCNFCNYVKYKKDCTTLFLCSTKCSDLYWYVEKYISKKNDNDVKIIFSLEKDECFKCGRRDFPCGLFTGIQIK